MESRPSPSAPKSGRSSPICSGVTCSIRFLTSISLIWVRKSGSDINERGFCRKLRVRSNVQNVKISHLAKATRGRVRTPKAYAKQRQRCALISHEVIWNAMRLRIAFEKLNLIGFIAWSNRRGPLRRCSGSAQSTLVVGSRDSRLGRFHVRLRNLGIRLSSFVQFVVELILGFLKFLYRLTHSAGELGQFLGSE